MLIVNMQHQSPAPAWAQNGVVNECMQWGWQAKYAKAMVEYEKEHPRPARRHKKERDPSQLKRPQSAYFFFLADYREAYKVHLK